MCGAFGNLLGNFLLRPPLAEEYVRRSDRRPEEELLPPELDIGAEGGVGGSTGAALAVGMKHEHHGRFFVVEKNVWAGDSV